MPLNAQNTAPEMGDLQSRMNIKHDLVLPGLPKESPQVLYQRPVLPQVYNAAEGHFQFHYTNTGTDAVAQVYTNPDGVPDFIYEAGRCAERVYRLLIDTLGFQPPPSDGIDGDATDIYVKNWGGSAYAYTYPENEVTATPRLYDYTAYTVIDNDYSEYLTAGLNGLRVTLAHEYFHVVQLGYNWWQSNNLPGATNGDTYFLEWCSTWFEERAYPEVNDYYNYMSAYFYMPTSSLWSSSYWYALGPFLRIILDEVGEKRLAPVWEGIKTTTAFAALETMLKDQQTSVATCWNQFCRRSYYTGARYEMRWALSTDAADFPLLQIAGANQALIGNLPQFPATIQPHATIPFRVLFNRDLYLSFQTSVTANGSGAASYLLSKYLIGDVHNQLGLGEKIYTGKVGYGDSLLIFVTNSSLTTAASYTISFQEHQDSSGVLNRLLAIYPNPINTNADQDLLLKIRVGGIVTDPALQCFDLAGREIFTTRLNTGLLVPGTYTLTLPAATLRNAQLTSGVFLMQMQLGGTRSAQKMVVIK